MVSVTTHLPQPLSFHSDWLKINLVPSENVKTLFQFIQRNNVISLSDVANVGGGRAAYLQFYRMLLLATGGGYVTVGVCFSVC